jgi:hypothetical protein
MWIRWIRILKTAPNQRRPAVIVILPDFAGVKPLLNMQQRPKAID